MGAMLEMARQRADTRLSARDRPRYRTAVGFADSLPYDEVLNAAGIEVVRKEGERGDFGASVRTTEGRVVIASVRAAGPAMRAGLLPGDELLAINGTRVSAASLVTLVEAAGKGKLSIVFARNDVMKTARTEVNDRGSEQIELSIMEKRSPAQEQLLSAWLGED